VLGPVASQQISGGLSPQVLVAPLLSGGRFYGVVQFTRQNWRPFTQEELRLADGIASHAAVALERARLVEQSYRLLRAIQSADEAVLIVDVKTRVLFANRAFHQLFGYSWPELQAVGVANLAELPASGWQAVRESLLREQRWRGELNALARDGSRFPISLHLSPIFAPDGSLEGVVAIAADIRAEKELQERFARAERLAAAGQLAAGLAHEVNNALAVILGQVEAVREAPEASAFESSLAHIQREGQKIARLIQDLLGFARPRPPEARPLDLAVLADDTLRLLEPELARAQVRVVREGPPRGLPVRGDLQQLQQVLLNLLKNAIEALTGTPDATITVRCRRAAGTVSVEVEDNGPGIPPALASRIFDPFFTTKPRGTGLGLSVSYAIVQAHGGELSVKSAPGAGTTFTLQLTADPGAQAHVENQPVLLVEDDDTLAATVQRMLERHGVPVRRAATGEEALALANATDFDAVLLDVQLPDFSGVEVFHRLQASHPELARRVAFVTGNLWRGASSEPLPPQPTLAKPCTSAELLAVVAQLRGLRRAA
jgi:two-component system NtrC family sensor kinase